MAGRCASPRCAAEQAPPQASVAEMLEYERQIGLDAPSTWLDFGGRLVRKIDVVKRVFGELGRRKRIWGYGAAGKATMWVNACEMDVSGGMVDASPLRAGKLMPGTHTPILFPDEFRKRQSRTTCSSRRGTTPASLPRKEAWYQGVWAVPLPDLRFF